MAQGSDGKDGARRAWEPRSVAYSRRGTEETARQGNYTMLVSIGRKLWRL